jgi:hypothetical protein
MNQQFTDQDFLPVKLSSKVWRFRLALNESENGDERMYGRNTCSWNPKELKLNVPQDE